VTTQALFREDAYLRECDAVVTRVGDDGVELDRTVFYPHGGGQAGDSGFLTTADGVQLRVVDARKAKRDDATPDDALHVIDPAGDWRNKLAVGTAVRAQIDWDRRYRHMRSTLRRTYFAPSSSNWSMGAASRTTTRGSISR